MSRKKKAYGTVQMKPLGSILALQNNVTSGCMRSVDPISFEELNSPFGYVLYETKLKVGGQKLTIPVIKDYGFVFLDGYFQGVLVDSFFDYKQHSIALNAQPGQTLTIIVENRGRISYDTINDFKGIISKVFLNDQIIVGWKQCALNPQNVDTNASLVDNPDPSKAANIFVGTFAASKKANTFLDTRGWGKGQVYLNGRNIGRYWDRAGPQKTLYIPSCFLQDNNTLIVMELLGSKKCFSNQCLLSLIDRPVYEYRKPDRPFDPPKSLY
ncbi:hypothetical protein L596_011842 [Steinernema carpocapsae]|uniref:Uncharacterized protein n=1 Tax=Steinernema carpocapsae TaxID=34508 RepID=A0A4V6A4L9_STECR|nr:hypothetical protein L596_011842 [Steinernema carpocapsae]